MAKKTRYIGKSEPVQTVTIKCLKCGKPFQSVDRKRNRICKDCNNSNSKTRDLDVHKPIVGPKPLR